MAKRRTSPKHNRSSKSSRIPEPKPPDTEAEQEFQPGDKVLVYLGQLPPDVLESDRHRPKAPSRVPTFRTAEDLRDALRSGAFLPDWDFIPTDERPSSMTRQEWSDLKALIKRLDTRADELTSDPNPMLSSFLRELSMLFHIWDIGWFTNAELRASIHWLFEDVILRVVGPDGNMIHLSAADYRVKYGIPTARLRKARQRGDLGAVMVRGRPHYFLHEVRRLWPDAFE